MSTPNSTTTSGLPQWLPPQIARNNGQRLVADLCRHTAYKIVRGEDDTDTRANLNAAVQALVEVECHIARFNQARRANEAAASKANPGVNR